MKVSLIWLQKYFEKPLPSMEKINDAITFHAFEVDKCENDLLDVDILPNRAADCLCHRGIAKEIGAILNIPLKTDPLREQGSALYEMGLKNKCNNLQIKIEDEKKCLRYISAFIKGVKIKPSPDWLRKSLESVGQRSINNIVDATNYVMLNIGQPLHAFDADKLIQKDGKYAINIRNAKENERITTLSDEEYTLSQSILLITDANADEKSNSQYGQLGIAGIKGGKTAELTQKTTNIIVESANFDGPTVRRAAQRLKLLTDASLRFQNRPSPKLAEYGMRDVLTLIKDIAGGEVECVVDVYPAPTASAPTSVTLERINNILGTTFSHDVVADVFKRLDFDFNISGDTFTITPPFERVDITIPENLIEEVGRIIGYHLLPSVQLPPIKGNVNQARFLGIEKIKDFLAKRGFTEISTQSFAKDGDIILANPLDKTKPVLRTALDDNMETALEKANHYAPLVLMPNQKPKLFEMGTVFTKKGEQLVVKTSEPVSDIPQIQDVMTYVPQQYILGTYKPFSIYPFMLRDIAFWAPVTTDVKFAKSIIRKNAGELLVRLEQFDHFEKDEKVSYAFRLVFQSLERTLTDEEINKYMEKITAALNDIDGYIVR